MILAIAQLLERYFNLPFERSVLVLSRGAVFMAASGFLLMTTAIVALDSVAFGTSTLGNLEVNGVAPFDIYAPESVSFVSTFLTEQRKDEARRGVPAVYNPPDLSVARAQTALAARIIEYIDNIRNDVYGTLEQRRDDLHHIASLNLSDETIEQILVMQDEEWSTVANEVRTLLEQVMQDSIRQNDLQGIIDRLPNQVALHFDENEVALITSVVEGLIRPNRTINSEETRLAQENAADAIPPQEVNLQRGQKIVDAGDKVGPAEYEMIVQLGLLQPAEERFTGVLRALFATIVIMVIFGLYLGRFQPALLYSEPRILTLLALIFLMVLAGARLTVDGDFYLYPSAVLALLFVAVSEAGVAIIATFGLSFLVGLMSNGSFEFAMLVAMGGLVGILTLRRIERLNSYFFAGLMVSVISVAVAAIFNLTSPEDLNRSALSQLVIFGLLNGVISAAASMIGLYLIAQVFNLTTAVKLIELSQPSQPLLQRLLREAPGTYQHSLNVANLSEQAATAIGANAPLVHVAALYHDIGKILNPAFFTENQRDIGGNPHDTLNDPYRSADIIIGHVIEGDEMARRYRLPPRIRDFIREHHGTTQVYVFYQQAIAQAGDDKDAVDIKEFTYQGPRPQSRETAILMLADSAEAAVRAIQPETRQQIEETVDKIFESKRKDNQLDESNLTLNDLNTIKRVFVDMLKATFHPRINYTEAVSKARRAQSKPVKPSALKTEPVHKTADDKPARTTAETPIPPLKVKTTEMPLLPDDEDDSPLPDVPPLPRANGKARETTETKQESLTPEDDKS